jgi:hypothetical protein
MRHATCDMRRKDEVLGMGEWNGAEVMCDRAWGIGDEMKGGGYLYQATATGEGTKGIVRQVPCYVSYPTGHRSAGGAGRHRECALGG